jgi:hypothetical protein
LIGRGGKNFISLSNRKSQIKNQKFIMGEHAPGGTKQRVSACRKRLRQSRATQRGLKLAQDKAALSASELSPAASDSGDFGDSENVFEEAGAHGLGATRRFTPEVDHRARLRAR